MLFPRSPPIGKVACLGISGYAAHSSLPGYQRIEEHDAIDAFTTAISHAGDRDAREGVTHQNDVGEVLKFKNLDNVSNVSLKPNVRTREMETLATAGAGGSVDPMAYRPQFVGDVLPYPATVPGAVHQYECGLLRGGRPAVVLGCGVLREAQGCQSGAAAAQYVSSSYRHGVLTWSGYRPCPRS